MPNIERSWSLRAVTAGLAAALVGTTLGAMQYRGLPGAMSLNWAIMPFVLLGFAALSGILGGLGIGAGMIVARRSWPRSPGRIVLGSTIGGALGCLLPAVVGIAGFGSLRAPYAGTANIIFSLVVGCAVFVALWAPALSARARPNAWATLGRAAVSAVVTCGAVGIAGWSLAASVGSIPTLDSLALLVEAHGMIPFATTTALLLGATVGGVMGLATWIDLVLEQASEHT
jgi:hypothetical protein